MVQGRDGGPGGLPREGGEDLDHGEVMGLDRGAVADLDRGAVADLDHGVVVGPG